MTTERISLEDDPHVALAAQAKSGLFLQASQFRRGRSGADWHPFALSTPFYSACIEYKLTGEIIQWSPDSKMAAAVNINVAPEYRKLILVSRDGDVTQIVSANYPQSDFYLGGLGWSPDSRYLAYINSYSGVNLYLYDTQTGNYVYRCPLPVMSKYDQSLIWSPDSQWIAIGDQPSGFMGLLNIQSGQFIELLENAIPVGWSEKFPVIWP